MGKSRFADIVAHSNQTFQLQPSLTPLKHYLDVMLRFVSLDGPLFIFRASDSYTTLTEAFHTHAHGRAILFQLTIIIPSFIIQML